MSKDYWAKSWKKKNNLYTSWVLLLNSSMDLSLKISKMLNLPENVVKKVLEVKEQNPKQNYEFLAKKISNEIDYILQADDIKEIIQKSRELIKWGKDKLKDLNDAINDNKKYEIVNDEYVIYTTVNSKEWKVKQVYRLPVELVDNIFNDFSKHWANLSGQEIMNKYQLKPKVRQLIKSNIGLYKDSNILSPLSMDNAENIDEVIEEATYKNFQDKYKNKYKEAHITNLEKEVKKQAKILGTIEGFMEYIQPIVNSIKPIHIQAIKHTNHKVVEPIYHIWDTHLGKQGTDLVVARLDIVANDIIAEESKKITIDFKWDIFEALMQWGMHSWQVESMNGVYGADLFMFGVNVFVKFLTKILKSGKQITFVGIWWNHDRASTLNEWDNERMYATIFYEMLKAYMGKANIEFKIIRDRIGLFEVDGINYLTGHEWVHNKQPEKVAWKYSNTGKHTVYTTAHIHNEWVFTGKNVTQLVINALAGEWEYDKRLWLHSYPWYTKSWKNEFWLPDHLSKRLP